MLRPAVEVTVDARVRREGRDVLCTGSRHWLRATPRPAGGLRVETTDRVRAAWTRVDGDVPLLTRAVLRVQLSDADAAHAFAAVAAELAGVRIPGERDAARMLARATYPLLAADLDGRHPAVPASLPHHLQAAFRHRGPREAARTLFGDRATRPVVRGLCAVLDMPVPDLFGLSVAVSASRHLEPDHVARLLETAVAANAGPLTELTSLTSEEIAGLAELLESAHPRRVMRQLVGALTTDADRQRLRFVADVHVAGGPTLSDAHDVAELALKVASAVPIATTCRVEGVR